MTGSEAHGPREDIDNEVMEGNATSGSIPLKVVTFHHAGYDPAQNNTVLFRLRGSIQYAGRVSATAVLLFLFMLTDQETVSNSFITLNRGGTPWNRGQQCDLHESDYWIHSTNPEDPNDTLYDFPLVPNMRMWKLPDVLPTLWSQGGSESIKKTRSYVKGVKNPTRLEAQALCNVAVIARDKYCVLSGEAEWRCERAYIIPPQLHEVWVSEKMSAFIGGRSLYKIATHADATTAANTAANPTGKSTTKSRTMDMHHPMNGICLRSDLKEAYDDGDFVIIPDGNTWVAHFADPQSDLGRMFDHGRLRISQEIPRQFLLVRAAWATFSLANSFLNQPVRVEHVPAIEAQRIVRPRHEWYQEQHAQRQAARNDEEGRQVKTKEDVIDWRARVTEPRPKTEEEKERKPELEVEEKEIKVPKHKTFFEKARQLKYVFKGKDKKTGDPKGTVSSEQSENAEPTTKASTNSTGKAKTTVPRKQDEKTERSSDDEDFAAWTIKKKTKDTAKQEKFSKQAASIGPAPKDDGTPRQAPNADSPAPNDRDAGPSQANHLLTFDEPERTGLTRKGDNQKVFRPKSNAFFTP